MRVIFDANVLISAVISRTGAPARLLGLCFAGEIELVLCPALLLEVEDTLSRRKLRSRVDPADATRFLAEVVQAADVVDDPAEAAPLRSADPDDDYLLALAARERVPLVTGDDHLLVLRDRVPVFAPREFLDQL